MSKRAFDLSGKTAIVTGGSRGIGLGISAMLAEHGASVVIASRTESECNQAVEEIKQSGNEAFACVTDISSTQNIEFLFSRTVEKYGKVDIVVNNSGAGILKPAIALTESEWTLMSEVNMKGTYFMCQYAAKQMLTQETRGNIVNISSNSARLGSPMMVCYAATKSYVDHLTRGLAAEWAKDGIRVNAVAPGTVPTVMTEPLLRNEDMKKRIEEGIPLKKLLTPRDIAAAVLYLASDEAGMVTGETICADGGRNIM